MELWREREPQYFLGSLKHLGSVNASFQETKNSFQEVYVDSQLLLCSFVCVYLVYVCVFNAIRMYHLSSISSTAAHCTYYLVELIRTGPCIRRTFRFVVLKEFLGFQTVGTVMFLDCVSKYLHKIGVR